jgi:hypothetical protein
MDSAGQFRLRKHYENPFAYTRFVFLHIHQSSYTFVVQNTQYILGEKMESQQYEDSRKKSKNFYLLKIYLFYSERKSSFIF